MSREIRNCAILISPRRKYVHLKYAGMHQAIKGQLEVRISLTRLYIRIILLTFYLSL